MHSRLLLASLALPIMLTACSSGEEQKNIDTIAASQSAAISFNILQGDGAGKASQAPSALLGMHIATFLTHSEGAITAAKKAAEIQAAQQDIAPTTNEAYLVLQQLGSALQMNIADLLNRSTNRRETLDAYVKDLKGTITGSERQIQALEARADDLDTKQDDQNDKVRAIEKDLNSALRKKDFSTAALKQEELQPVEGELRKIELQQEEVENLLDIYEDLMELASQRLDAIDKNREVLIAGLGVVDVPGIDDLGVLQRQKGRKFGL